MLQTRIEELINEYGESVQSIAEMGHLDRTTIQKIKSGKRLPTREFLCRFSQVLQLSKPDEDELLDLLEMEKCGMQIYQNRQTIKELIELISELTEYEIPIKKNIDTKSIDINDVQILEENKSVYGLENIIALMHQVIDREVYFREEPRIKLVSSSDQNFLYHYLFHEMMGNRKRLIIQDIVCFTEEENSQGDQALSTLKFLLGISLLENVTYDANYMMIQDQNIKSNQSGVVFFILTTTEVMVISPDFKLGVRYRTQDKLDYYNSRFNALFSQTKQLIIDNNNPLQIYSAFDLEYEPRVILEPIPCFAHYFTDLFIEDKVRKDFPFYQALLPFAKSFYSNLRKSGKAMKNVFSFKYLEIFMENGELYLPESVSETVDPPERLAFLKLVRDDLASGKRKFNVVNETLFFINNAAEYSDEVNSLQITFHYRIKQKQVFKSINIRKASIRAAFKDFFSYLSVSEWVNSERITLEKLNVLIDKYEKRPEFQMIHDRYFLGGEFKVENVNSATS
ncbi:helix-turn-helix transcriptional regulator [Eubacteriaceae bacterium ES3]|nr:helix-turn-helix transcriptional regulator [Eubacteriaceae bacterium ES3]